jgi:hypothetical protein
MKQVEATKSSYTNLTVLKSWMSGMGEGASENDVGVLYCCAEPNIHMNGVTVPAAYAVRSSPDYVGGGYGSAIHLPTVQWAIGPDAAFHWNGLGLLPYKDTFISNSSSSQKAGLTWSNDSTNWPSFSGYHEQGAATHALMSLLSMAHVTFADAVGESNATLIKQLIREDGMLLKTDRPATAIDAQFQAMMFGAWPGDDPGPAGKEGSLFTMACDTHNLQQQFAYVCTHNPYRCVLKLAGSSASKDCLHAGSSCGDAAIGIEVLVGDNNNGQPCGLASSNTTCQGQDWLLVENKLGPKGVPRYSVHSAVNTSAGQPMCLQLQNGGAALAACDTGSIEQGWYTKGGRPGKAFFSLTTTWHDDTVCLTASKSWKNGASSFDSEEQRQQLAEEVFPRTGEHAIGQHQLTDQYRAAYTLSAGLMRQIEGRQAQAHAQCKGKVGSPQGPLGEIYTTHTTVADMTWIYVVGVQLSSDFNVSTFDLAIGSVDGAAGEMRSDGVTQYVSYSYNEAVPGFQPTTTADIKAVTDKAAVELTAGTNEMCNTGPDYGVKTRCFPFQLHAVAPVASNGWVLTGEVGKFVPISSQRISSISVLLEGGFEVGLTGAPGEVVRMGAVNAKAGRAPVYAQAVIGNDGTAVLALGGQGQRRG